MKTEAITGTIFKKGFKSIPNVVWVLCASYALIMFTNLIVLKFADIDANKHISRYLDIVLTKQEAQTIPNKEIEIIYTLIAKNNQENLKQDKIILQLQEENKILKENSHPPAN